MLRASGLLCKNKIRKKLEPKIYIQCPQAEEITAQIRDASFYRSINQSGNRNLAAAGKKGPRIDWGR